MILPVGFKRIWLVSFPIKVWYQSYSVELKLSSWDLPDKFTLCFVQVMGKEKNGSAYQEGASSLFQKFHKTNQLVSFSFSQACKETLLIKRLLSLQFRGDIDKQTSANQHVPIRNITHVSIALCNRDLNSNWSKKTSWLSLQTACETGTFKWITTEVESCTFQWLSGRKHGKVSRQHCRNCKM